jgi:UDP-glucose 4-epimerase
VAFLTFGRGLDTTRMREMLGFEPQYTTAGAFADFADSVVPGFLGPDRVRATEAALVGALTSGGDAHG